MIDLRSWARERSIASVCKTVPCIYMNLLSFTVKLWCMDQNIGFLPNDGIVLLITNQRKIIILIGVLSYGHKGSYESPCFSIVFPIFHCLKIVRTAFVAVRNGICDRGLSNCYNEWCVNILEIRCGQRGRFRNKIVSFIFQQL